MKLVLLLMLALPAEATRLKVETVACPLGGAPAKVYEKLVSNTLGGFDSDLMAYSSEGQFRQYAVSTCPDSLLSLYGSDMKAGLSDAEKATVRAALPAILAPMPPVDALQAWDRHAIAAEVYRALGRGPMTVANAYLKASWVARDHAVGVYTGLEGPVSARALLDAGEQELDKGLTPDQRRAVLFNLARVAHRGGYNAEREGHLSALEKTPGVQARETAAIAKMRHIAGTAEPHLQDGAIVAFTEALRQPKLGLDDKIRATYLLADLLRRRDRPRDALPLYARVLAETQAPLNLREMSVVLAKELTDSGVAGADDPSSPR
jgi:hypothetical protein